jgi:hypothetical protein
MQPGEELEDHIGYDKQSIVSILQRNIDRFEAGVSEQSSKLSLIERMKRSSPWRHCKVRGRYWVISQLASHNDLGSRAKMAAIQHCVNYA